MLEICLTVIIFFVMGSCTSKPNIEPQVLNRRRRLSINQSHESASLSLKNDKFAELNGNNRDLSNSITSNCQVRGTSGRRRASIFGAPALEIQREFEVCFFLFFFILLG